MSTNILPLQKKLRIAFFSLIFSGLLIYLSQNLNLNDKSQRLLAKFLNVPQQFITQVLNEYQEFENQKIAQLQDEILNLQNEIYENEVCISPVKSLSLHLTNINSSYGLSPFLDYKKFWEDNK